MSTPTYDEVRKRIEKRYERYSIFVFHFIMAFVGIALLRAADPTPADGTPVIAVLWGAVLVFHAIQIAINEVRDRAVERTWRRLSDGFVDKPKRRVRLTDDAELEFVDDEAVEAHSQRLEG